MSKHRSRLEVVLTVLSVVADGSDKPTHIMYSANMSWTLTQSILSQLVKQGLLEVRTASESSRRRYTITEKGFNVIDYFDKAKEILPKDIYFAHA